MRLPLPRSDGDTLMVWGRADRRRMSGVGIRETVSNWRGTVRPLEVEESGKHTLNR